MQFNKNKQTPVHRWYPFVEGYSKEFIESIIEESGNKIHLCLEPFSGSGTTALELQNMGIKCISFEVNPFMYLLGSVKLENTYQISETEKWFSYIIRERSQCKDIELESNFDTLFQTDNKQKWNYDREAGRAIKKLQCAIYSISAEVYRDLFTIALAAILLDVSNLYRNGKCLSYKKDWQSRNISEADVYRKFDQKVQNELIYDIANMQLTNDYNLINNKKMLYNKDSRTALGEIVEDNSIDLVITSPPYLNSRDYTDTYMLELKTLGFTKTAEEIRQLREKTLRSHVQIKWEDKTTIENSLLQETIWRLNYASKEETVWNRSIIDMVRLYFVDMQNIFEHLYNKMRIGGKVYFNMSNSAYFKVLINTLEICASIAEQTGFKVTEIRIARYLKTSPQQQQVVGKLLEGVLVLER